VSCPLRRPEIFLKLNPCCRNPYITLSLTRRWVYLLWICLTFLQVYVSHIQHITENSSFCIIYKSSVSPGFAKQITPILRVLCYNGSLVTWTVVSLTTAKFKPLIFNWLSSKPRLAYNLSARTTQKTPFFCCGTIVSFVSVAAGMCLLSCCPETALVYPPISRSLHTNRSTRYSIFLLSTIYVYSNFLCISPMSFTCTAYLIVLPQQYLVEGSSYVHLCAMLHSNNMLIFK
jgi:hypothetical protein